MTQSLPEALPGRAEKQRDTLACLPSCPPHPRRRTLPCHPSPDPSALCGHELFFQRKACHVNTPSQE